MFLWIPRATSLDILQSLKKYCEKETELHLFGLVGDRADVYFTSEILEHDVLVQPLLISSHRGEPCFLPGEWQVRLEHHCDDRETPLSRYKKSKILW